MKKLPTKMRKVNIHISEAQHALMCALNERTGIPLAAITRRALTMYLRGESVELNDEPAEAT